MQQHQVRWIFQMSFRAWNSRWWSVVFEECCCSTLYPLHLVTLAGHVDTDDQSFPFSTIVQWKWYGFSFRIGRWRLFWYPGNSAWGYGGDTASVTCVLYQTSAIKCAAFKLKTYNLWNTPHKSCLHDAFDNKMNMLCILSVSAKYVILLNSVITCT